MTFFAEERAVSPVLGGILMFGLAMSLLILTQVSVVPAANQQLEFEHNQGLQEDFERFGSSTTRVAGSGSTETVDFDLGVRYPNRFFLVNPGPASGDLSTDAATFAIENVTSTNPETAEYYSSLGNDLNYQTNRLVYEPNYRQYSNAPRTVYENGAVLNQYDGDVTLLMSRTPIVNDGDITLVLLDGDVNEQSTGVKSLALQAASAPAKRISITDDGEPITLRIGTLLPESDWQEYADGESAVSLHKYVDADADPRTPNEVVLRLDDSRDYTLRVARLTVGENAATEGPAYVTSVGSYASSVPANTSITYTAEVRDAQNNPISGGEVTATIDGRATFSNGNKAINVSVDEDGRASVTVTGNTNALGNVNVDIGRDTDKDNDLSDEDAHKYVTYTFELVTTDVTNIDQVSDVGSSINPGLDSETLVFETSSLTNNDLTMTFNYTGTEAAEITSARVNYYFVSKPGANGIADSMVITTESGATKTLEVGGVWQDLGTDTYTLAPGGELVIESELFQQDGSDYTLKGSSDDFFMLSLEFSDGSTKVYIIPVSK